MRDVGQPQERVDTASFGPLAAFAGVWEGDRGVIVSQRPADQGELSPTYRERLTLRPFGPLRKRSGELHGLDYSMTAWRPGADHPFHTEVGYWLWRPEAAQVVRANVQPPGSAIVAGGNAAPDSTAFTLRADAASGEFGICAVGSTMDARCVAYTFSIDLDVAAATLAYEETSMLVDDNEGPFAHVAANTLRRVGDLDLDLPNG